MREAGRRRRIARAAARRLPASSPQAARRRLRPTHPAVRSARKQRQIRAIPGGRCRRAFPSPFVSADRSSNFRNDRSANSADHFSSWGIAGCTRRHIDIGGEFGLVLRQPPGAVTEMGDDESGAKSCEESWRRRDQTDRRRRRRKLQIASGVTPVMPISAAVCMASGNGIAAMPSSFHGKPVNRHAAGVFGYAETSSEPQNARPSVAPQQHARRRRQSPRTAPERREARARRPASTLRSARLRRAAPVRSTTGRQESSRSRSTRR